jgi:membrane-associated protein
MFNVDSLIQTGGLLLIALIIFGESGMFIGFFFPGDTLLLSAGIFAAQGKLDLATLLPTVALAAIIGDNIGYLIGKHYGRHLFDKPNSIVFRREYLRQSEDFFAKYGSRAMLIAHFVPVVRTFAPAAAGISRMNHKQFFVYDAIGDTVWAVLVTMIGYWFGQRIPNIDHYILLAVVAVMAITLGPALYHLTKAIMLKRRESKNAKSSD